MKTIVSKLYIGLILLAVLGCQNKLFVEDLAEFDPNSDVSVYEVTLSNPGQTSGMIYIDIGSGEVYNYAEATKQPEKVDFAFLWGSSSAVNFVSPDNTVRLEEWGTGKNINANWFIKNRTTFVRLEKSVVPLDFYNNIRSSEAVKHAYAELKTLAESQSNYNVRSHGEDTQLRNITEGDLIAFRTAKNVYAVAKVQIVTAGNTGSVSLAFKVYKKEETAVEPISPSELYEPFEIAVDRLAELRGASLLDLSNGSGFTMSEGYYNQHVVDAVLYNNGEGVVISSLNANIPLLQEDVRELASDWELKTKTKFIRLKASSDTESRWNTVQKNSQIKALFAEGEGIVKAYDDYASEVYGPAISVKGMQIGDLILYHSEDRDIYGVIRVTDIGTAFLDGQVKANVYSKKELGLPRLKEFTSSGSVVSAAAYVDFKTGTVWTTEEEGKANASSVDVVSVRGSSSGNNFFPTTNNSAAAAWAASWGTRMAEWQHRNAVYIYGYIGDNTPSEWWDLYYDLKEDQSMWNAFQTATVGLEPVQRLKEMGSSTDPMFEKTVIFIHCMDRKMLVALRVKERTATSITYRYKVIDVN